jgi:hypothetical protein
MVQLGFIWVVQACGEIEALNCERGSDNPVELLRFRRDQVMFNQDLDCKLKVDCWGIVVTQPHRCTRLLVRED